MLSHLVVDEAVAVLQRHGLLPARVVAGGQRQAAQRVAAGAVLPDHRQHLLLDGGGQGNLVAADADVGAPVNHALRSSLQTDMQRRAGRGQASTRRGEVGSETQKGLRVRWELFIIDQNFSDTGILIDKRL